MNREYLFRGKLLNGKWAFGNLDIKPNGISIIAPGETLVGCYGQVIPETVGEFTGLIDRNGKYIFEGDILECERCIPNTNFQKEKFRHEVYFDRGQFYALQDYLFDKFVVGNVHDNPELLEALK